ncbi:GNAT family N-acetyltransferase [Chitinophagales bacterium]|nr:GNAT family N-acetyltransferase [Chitinophagales bacterium]
MLQSSLIYRKLTAKDSLAYREIRLESLVEFPEAFGSNYEQQLAKPKLAFQGFLEQDAVHKVFGCFTQNELLGICAYFRTDNSAELIQVYLKPAYHGHGIGKQLLTSLIDFAKSDGVTCLDLGVAEQNSSAIRTYQSLGFVLKESQSNTTACDLLFTLQF